MIDLPPEMHGELERWLDAAHSAKYCMSRLARLACMNPRQLRRYFLETYRRRPKDFLDEIRARQAAVALHAGFSAKEVAVAFHFRDAAHLNHSLKKHLGVTPTQLAARRPVRPAFGGVRDPVTAARVAGSFLQAKVANLQGAGVGPAD